MKSFCVTLIVVAGLFYFACQSDRPRPESTSSVDRQTSVVKKPHDDSWRRTTEGWEKSSQWRKPNHVSETPTWNVGAVHPALVALLQLLISLGALVWHEPKLS